MTTDEAKQEIQRLVDKYEKLDSRAVKRYKEANTRDVFIRPLFEALGWDFSNFDEVEAEKTIIAGRVDYLFKLNKVSKFCIEIKALHTDINEERWIRQAIGYAYNKGVTWAVLTNFKTLRVFNAERETKDINQIAFLNLTCGNYLADFHRLWLLSREAVANKDLDKEAEAYGRLPPRLPVEKRLYAQLRDWRETLFNEIYLYYKDDKEERLTWTEVDQLVQHLLNRLIFIRTAEDRGLIDRNLLAARHQWESSGGETDLMGSLRDIFHQFASLYDSDLFPLAMDRWDLVSVHNDRILSDIIQGLYEVPGGLADWDFATIGSDVLGTVYEQYLGYVPERIKKEVKEAQQRLFPAEPHIGLTAKKEKRKGEGIYYTPAWVVDYIVKQTVGRFIEEHNYNDILSIRILDPACGSGSFLTRAYEELLNYHARQQGKSPAELEQWERTRILLRNIYGVDLDQQAVEIARLSLLLCSLSGQETLPPLADNIRRGNSLISGMDEELRRYFGDRWEEKHRFNWDEEFPEIMKDGGFDVVMGNPPYVRNRELNDDDKKFFKGHYEGASGQYDLYQLFIEKSIALLREGGILGMITSNKYAIAEYGKKLRQFILDHSSILQIIDVSNVAVFRESATYPYIIVLRNESKLEARQNTGILVLEAHSENDLSQPLAFRNISQPELPKGPSSIFNISLQPNIASLINSIQAKSESLGDLYFVREAIHTGNIRKKLVSDTKIDERYKPLLFGRDCHRYDIRWRQKWILFDPNVVDKSQGEYANFPDESLFTSEKVLIREIDDSLTATFDHQGFYTLNKVYSVLPKSPQAPSLKFLLCCLNSRLLDFIYKALFTPGHVRGGYLQFKPVYLNQLPICRIDFANPEEKRMHGELVALVERMLELNKRLAPIRNTPCNEQDELQREIERTDGKIDNLVYDLYRLTKEEKEIVKKETEGGS